MSEKFEVDETGGEYRIVDGQELVAVWLPITRAEKKALMEKAKAERVNIPKLLTTLLTQWKKGKSPAELSVQELAGVAGGRAPMRTGDTTMCPW
jgi:hypothetical protein